jgi:hypothetical protein
LSENVLLGVCLDLFSLFELMIAIVLVCRADDTGACIYCWNKVNTYLEDILFINCTAGGGGAALWFLGQDDALGIDNRKSLSLFYFIYLFIFFFLHFLFYFYFD